jgi:hypothetical protein
MRATFRCVGVGVCEMLTQPMDNLLKHSAKPHIGGSYPVRKPKLYNIMHAILLLPACCSPPDKICQ